MRGITLSPEATQELLDTLRYLKREFDGGFRIDHINMMHVDKALTRADIEISMQRARATNPAIPLSF